MGFIACRTGVIFLRFSGEREQARGERKVRDTRDGRGAKKITLSLDCDSFQCAVEQKRHTSLCENKNWAQLLT